MTLVGRFAVAAITALIKMSDEQIKLGEGLTLDLARGCLMRGEADVHLRPQAYEVLKYLAENRGRLVGKDRLIEEVWKGRAVTDGALGKCIEEVREAFGEQARDYVRNVRGRGYILDTAGGTEVVGAGPLRTEQVDLVRILVEDEFETEDERRDGAGAVRRALPPPHVGKHLAGGRRAVTLAVACLLAVGVAVGAAYYFFLRPVPVKSDNPAGVGSLAVLPFKPLAPGGREEALEVGMADTLIAKLSNISGLSVRPLGSVRSYGGLEQDPLSAGRQLGVEAVLDGTIHRSGDRVGVTARLLSVNDGRQVWEGRFDAPFTDIFSVQDAISAKVAGSLRPRLTGAEERRLAKHYTANVEAYQLYLRGRYHLLKNTRAEIQTAISHFRQAVEIDRSYALAYVGLAEAYRVLTLAGESPATEELPQLKAAARKAVEIDDGLAEAHACLGLISFWNEWEWEAAENQFKRAVELDPNSADTHQAYATLLSYTGRDTEALAEIKRGRELDPLNVRTGALEGAMLINAGRPDEALARLQKTLELEPDYWFARQYVASAYIEKGMYAEAVTEARKARELSGVSTRPTGFLGYALAKAGRRAEARAEFEGLLRLSKERHVSPYNIAIICHGLGESDEALAWLERGYREREPRMVFLKAEPKWNSLRDDPRFQDLLRRIGFPQ